jgi:hypothetical protein
VLTYPADESPLRDHLVEIEPCRVGIGEHPRHEGLEPALMLGPAAARGAGVALMNEPTPRRVSSTPSRSRCA